MAYPTSALVLTDRVGVEMMNKINSHFSDDTQHAGQTVPAASYGIAPGNTAAQNRTGLRSLANTTASVYFPAGNYQVDNNAGNINLGTFSGLIDFAPGATLVFSNVSNSGLFFGAGTRPVLRNVSVRYTTTPTVRQDAMPMKLYQTIEPYVVNYRADGSPGTGATFEQCFKPRYTGAYVKNTVADGTMFANCHDPHITDCHFLKCGDDSLSLNNYSGLPDAKGGYASGITVKDGSARGLYIGGISDFTLENFFVENTDGPGVMCQWDQGYGLRQAANATIRNGTIVNSGGLAGDMTEHWGLCLQQTLGESVIENITIKDAQGMPGLYVGQNIGATTHVTIRNVQAVDCTDFGILAQLNTSIHIENCQAIRSGNTGIRLASNGRTTFKDLMAMNCSLTDGNKRAFSFSQWDHADSPAVSYLSGEGIHVYDDQATPTGYRVEFSAITSHAVDGDVGEINAYTRNALPNYVTFSSGSNMTAKYRVWHAGSQSSRSTAVPTAGWWRAGEIVWNSAPTAGGNIGWVCTAQGNPGTWKTFGTIAA
jgi:hypothetical protein